MLPVIIAQAPIQFGIVATVAQLSFHGWDAAASLRFRRLSLMQFQPDSKNGLQPQSKKACNNSSIGDFNTARHFVHW